MGSFTDTEKARFWFCIFIIFINHFYRVCPAEIASDNLEYDTEYILQEVMEKGCPIIHERNKLNITKLNGDWRMPCASRNWIEEISMTIYNRTLKVSQIVSICPRVTLSHNKGDNTTWTLLWKCPKLNVEFELRCWSQSNTTMSNFVCRKNEEEQDFYMMVGATNHYDWIVLVRCSSPEVTGRQSEGLSWVILSKKVPLDYETANLLLGLLSGYGFKVHEIQAKLSYDDCSA
ncbi:unnamed protein product [Orchesella dallaii]|uniref:Uncharacterized protein n=1 Tax=Orchesella dallaii TaxID=48710 RepID=A0ABP1Q6Z7_9HEXA